MARPAEIPALFAPRENVGTSAIYVIAGDFRALNSHSRHFKRDLYRGELLHLPQETSAYAAFYEQAGKKYIDSAHGISL